MDTIDSRLIPLDEPIPEAIVRIVEQYPPWDVDVLQETSDITSFPFETSGPLRAPVLTDRPNTLFDWLGVFAHGISKSLVTALAATQINIAKLSTNEPWTTPIDPSIILRIVSEHKLISVSVSPALVMPRSQVRASSLLAPSGGYLAWMEMLAEDPDDQPE